MEIKKIRPVVYVSGPYTPFENVTVDQNIKIAQKYAHALRLKGFAVVCPHSNGGDSEFIPDELTWQNFIEEDYSIILSCHAMFMLPNWEKSKGAGIENEWAKKLGIPIFYSNNYEKYFSPTGRVEFNLIVPDEKFIEESFTDIIKHFQNKDTVWEKCPNQVKEFLITINEMFRLHLSKNQDYSPFNILGTGEVGLATRTWDKVARLMNLVGFNIMTGQLKVGKEPKHEDLDQNILDLGVYSIIWRLFRKGKWGC